MSEEIKTDVNENPSSESSSEQVLGIADASNSEADPQSAQSSTQVVEEKTVPYSRFKEINDAKNDLSRRLESLESQFQEQEEKSKPKKIGPTHCATDPKIFCA